MNKRQIKSIIRRLKYYNNRLDVLQDKVKELVTLKETNEKLFIKEGNRFQKESEIVAKLFQLHAIKSLPTTYDILENPKQILIKDEALRLMESEEAKDNGMVSRGGFNFIYMSSGEKEIYNEILKELTQ